MVDSLIRKAIIPGSSGNDTEVTTDTLATYVESASGVVVAVHVIEKASGAPDKASGEQRGLYADELFETVTGLLADTDVEVDPRCCFGMDGVETIIAAAPDLDASATVFTPWGGSHWVKLLASHVTTPLVNKRDLPVFMLSESSAGEANA